MRPACVSLAASALLVASTVAAQGGVRVALSITDSAANRVFQGAFASAFRSLGDVEVVSVSERPQHVLSGVVICEPVSCQSARYYSAALRFWSPISQFTARLIAGRTIALLPSTNYVQRADSVAQNVVWPLLQGYETTHGTWVVEWGRERYEQAIREFVRQLDTECFERGRAYARAFASTDTATSSAIVRMIDNRRWLC